MEATLVSIHRRSIALGAKKFAPIITPDSKTQSLRFPKPEPLAPGRDRSNSSPALGRSETPLQQATAAYGAYLPYGGKVPPLPVKTSAGKDVSLEKSLFSKNLELKIEEPEEEQKDETSTERRTKCGSCRWLPVRLAENWCFIVLICSFLSNAIIFGTLSGLSVFLDIWKKQFCQSSTVVSFIPSLGYSMLNMTTLVLPLVLARVSHRFVIVGGAVVASLGVFGAGVASASTSLVALVLLFVGVTVASAGTAMVYSPGVILTGEVFMQSGRRAMGYSIAELGAAVGPIGIVPLFQYLKTYNSNVSFPPCNSGTPWPLPPQPPSPLPEQQSGSANTALIVAGIMFSLMVFLGFFMRSAEKTIDQEQEKKTWRKISRRGKSENINDQSVSVSLATVPLGRRVDFLKGSNKRRHSMLTAAAEREAKGQKTHVKSLPSAFNPEARFRRSVTRRHPTGFSNPGYEPAEPEITTEEQEELESVEEELEEIKSVSRFDLAVLKDPKFLLYILYVCVHAGGMLSIIILQIPYLEEAKKLTSDKTTQIVAAMSGGDLAARILFGVAASNKKIASVAIYFFLVAEYLIFIILFTYALIPEGDFKFQMIMTILLGLCRGTWAVNTWTLQSDIFGAENLTKVAGFSQFGGGLVILILPPIMRQSDVNMIPYTAGGLIVVAAIILTIIIFYSKIGNMLKKNSPK